MELTVVIPTRDRRETLLETLARLERQEGDVGFEAIVVDDGSSDGTPAAVRAIAERAPFELTLIEQPGRGPAAARNRALAAARGPACLFINDDAWPGPDLLARHRDFHARRPQPEAALLGRIGFPPIPAPTPFMRWLAAAMFDFDGIDHSDDVGGKRFYTANVSAKTAFVRGTGGFDEDFPYAAHEDIDLGLRLEQRGMRLAYDPDAVVEHSHPMDLERAIERLRQVGVALAPFAERHAGWAVPRRPGMRHRAKASALTGLTVLGARAPRLKREVWRFLCHEATREGYWATVDGAPAPPRLRIGGTLARLASRDPDARMPGVGAPRPA
jgi:glycosyltransferase involved in cell wall biosynthesis